MPLNLNGNIISASSITGSTFSNTIVSDGLVLHYDAANRNSYVGTGTAWNDLSISGINGALSNNIVYTSTYGGELTFDGSHDYVSLGTVTPTSPISPILNFTIEQIFKPTGYQGTTYFGLTNFLLGKGSLSTINYLTELLNSTTVTFVKRGTGEGLTTSSFTVPTMTNAINILTFVIINTQTIKCFMNGVLIGMQAIAGPPIEAQSSEDVYISNSYTPLAFIGKYYSCKIYNKALHNAEILSNYYSIKTRFGL